MVRATFQSSGDADGWINVIFSEQNDEISPSHVWLVPGRPGTRLEFEVDTYPKEDVLRDALFRAHAHGISVFEAGILDEDLTTPGMTVDEITQRARLLASRIGPYRLVFSRNFADEASARQWISNNAELLCELSRDTLNVDDE